MDWSLLGCGAGGHSTYAPDEPALRERLSTTTRDGEAWRCLRCGTFVIGPPDASGAAAAAPRVRRGKEVRSALILRVFAVERFLRALIFAALAIAVWRFSVSRMSLEESYEHALPPLKAVLRDLGFSIQHSKVLGLINRAFTTDPRILAYLAIGCAAYAVIEVIEGTGLWLLKRWGEYFAMIATSVGLPFEIWDLTNKVTALRVVALLINLALVVYLVLAKRLFGVRGGKKAYEAALRSESILDAEISAAAAERPGAGAAGAGAGTADAGPAGASQAGASQAGASGTETAQASPPAGTADHPEAAGGAGDTAPGPADSPAPAASPRAPAGNPVPPARG